VQGKERGIGERCAAGEKGRGRGTYVEKLGPLLGAHIAVGVAQHEPQRWVFNWRRLAGVHRATRHACSRGPRFNEDGGTLSLSSPHPPTTTIPSRGTRCRCEWQRNVRGNHLQRSWTFQSR